MPKLLVPLLSVIAVAVGAVPAYLLYVSRKIVPEGVLETHASLKTVHKFFWNRWYIDSFYYMFFVDGATKLFTSIPKYVENPLDKFYHRLIPSIPKRIYEGRPALTRETGIGIAVLVVLLFILLYFIMFLRR